MKRTLEFLAIGMALGLTTSAPAALLDKLQGYYTFESQTNGATPNMARAFGYTAFTSDSGTLLKPVPIAGSVADSLIHQNIGDDDDDFTPIIPKKLTEPEKKPGLIQRLFTKKDTTKKEELVVDTVGKTKKEIRQEKRALKKLEKQRDKELHDKGLQ